MVKKMSALLHLRNELQVGIPRNHTEMVKFSSVADVDYRTVANHIGNYIKDIITRADNDEDNNKECGIDTTEVDERRRKGKRKRRRVIASRNNSESENEDEDESGSGTEGESGSPGSDSVDSSSESGESSGNDNGNDPWEIDKLGDRIKKKDKLDSNDWQWDSDYPVVDKSSSDETDDEEMQDAFNKLFFSAHGNRLDRRRKRKLKNFIGRRVKKHLEGRYGVGVS
ncbi:uncharacterized protein LAJ45_09412 [Morchella importuna]|uniref:uncharacterized protein n=1 Tax=Morchella importuna TaxID=1174673 RepID=UPI001E8E0908|nr:uncharacterized protein LAJ45_09412 [Morchella importuna]KAH8146466.1 hypothetical protein LAJ45_09412 [Morchella importuna]